MPFEHREFSLLLGSDVARDGMYLELKEGSEPTGRLLAEWFYSDVDGTLSLTVMRPPSRRRCWIGSGRKRLAGCLRSGARSKGAGIAVLVLGDMIAAAPV